VTENDFGFSYFPLHHPGPSDPLNDE